MCPDVSFPETSQRTAVVHNNAASVHTASSLEPAWVGGVRASTGIEGVAREARSCPRLNHELLQNAHMRFNEGLDRLGMEVWMASELREELCLDVPGGTNTYKTSSRRSERQETRRGRIRMRDENTIEVRRERALL